MPKNAKAVEDDAFWSGYLAAMGVVYNFERDATTTLLKELVINGDSKALLRVAKKNEDCFLPMLRKTVRWIQR
jgi:hypothetical protein